MKTLFKHWQVVSNPVACREEMLAYDFTRQVATTHQINSDLYEQAIETFGEKGVVDMLVLAGHYMTVSALLNTFEVPAPVSQ